MDYILKIICYLIIESLYGLINYHLIFSNFKNYKNKTTYKFHKILVGIYLISFSFQIFTLVDIIINQTFSLIIIFILLLHYLIFEITNLLARINFIDKINNENIIQENFDDIKIKTIKNKILFARLIIIFFTILYIFIFYEPLGTFLLKKLNKYPPV